MTLHNPTTIGLSDRALYRMRDSGTQHEKEDALEQLVARALVYTPSQIKENRKPRPIRETEQERAGTWGWGGRQ